MNKQTTFQYDTPGTLVADREVNKQASLSTHRPMQVPCAVYIWLIPKVPATKKGFGCCCSLLTAINVVAHSHEECCSVQKMLLLNAINVLAHYQKCVCSLLCLFCCLLLLLLTVAVDCGICALLVTVFSLMLIVASLPLSLFCMIKVIHMREVSPKQ